MTTDDYPRCKTCKHWDVPDEWEDSHLGHCLGAGSLYASATGHQSTKFKIDGYDKTLLTHDDFGCIHHSDLETND